MNRGQLVCGCHDSLSGGVQKQYCDNFSCPDIMLCLINLFPPAQTTLAAILHVPTLGLLPVVACKGMIPAWE